MREAVSEPRESKRPRGARPCVAWVTPEEKAIIEATADACDLSVSAYLRTLGLGHEPKSILDVKIMRDLLHAIGDLGRLGGLLKMWLVDRPGEGAAVQDVRDLLNQIGDLRAQVADKVAAL